MFVEVLGPVEGLKRDRVDHLIVGGFRVTHRSTAAMGSQWSLGEKR